MMLRIFLKKTCKIQVRSSDTYIWYWMKPRSSEYHKLTTTAEKPKDNLENK